MALPSPLSGLRPCREAAEESNDDFSLRIMSRLILVRNKRALAAQRCQTFMKELEAALAESAASCPSDVASERKTRNVSRDWPSALAHCRTGSFGSLPAGACCGFYDEPHRSQRSKSASRSSRGRRSSKWE